jgi:hypothetical protein
MQTAANSRAKRAISRARRIWSELDYAQRRLFEIRTGVRATAPEMRASVRRQVEELERLYAYEDPRFSES